MQAVTLAHASATRKPGADGFHVPEEVFTAAWEGLRSAAQQLLSGAANTLKSIPLKGRLNRAARKKVHNELSEMLKLASTSPADVIAGCIQEREAHQSKAKRRKTSAKASPRANPAKPEVLANAFKKLAAFDYNLFAASAGNAAKFLKTDELKQLAIEKVRRASAAPALPSARIRRTWVFALLSPPRCSPPACVQGVFSKDATSKIILVGKLVEAGGFSAEAAAVHVGYPNEVPEADLAPIDD